MTALNAKLSPVDQNDAFRILDNDALTAFLSLPSYCPDLVSPDTGFLAEASSLIALYTSHQKSAPLQRASTGLEIGAGSAKLIVKLWNEGTRGKTIADVKLRLPKYGRSPDAIGDYAHCVNAIIESFTVDWLVPPKNFDFDNPGRLLQGCPRAADFTYVYGTQGPRDVSRIARVALSPKMHVLSGDEEGLLMFEAIVPAGDKMQPGTMAIEVGSGSTEIILVGLDGEKYPITFSVGAKEQSGLAALCHALARKDVDAAAQVYLESAGEAARSFMRALEQVAARRLFMNPNRDSEAFRTRVSKGGQTPLPTGAVIAFGAEMSGQSYARKATILGESARALGFSQIHEGMRGGLKEGMAKCVGAALAAAKT